MALEVPWSRAGLQWINCNGSDMGLFSFFRGVHTTGMFMKT